MAFTLDVVQTSNTSPLSITLASGAKLAVATFSNRKASGVAAVTSVQLGGVAMTALTWRNNTTIASQIWYLVDPPTGAQNLTWTSGNLLDRATISSYTVAAGKSAAYDGVDVGTTGTSTGPSQSVTPSNQPNVIITTCAHEGAAVMTAKGTGQVGLEPAAGDGFYDEGVWNTAHTYEPTTLTSADTQSFTNAASDVWAISCAVFKEIAANITLTPAAATATADGTVPVVAEVLLPATATATALGSVPVMAYSVSVPVALATADGTLPVLQVVLLPVQATATADGLIPTILAGGGAITILPPLATATAVGTAPVLQAVLLLAAATATAAGLAPVLQVAVLPTAATATGAGLAPSLLIGIFVLPPVASATAAALTPTLVIPITILAPIATATAQGIVAVIVTGTAGVPVADPLAVLVMVHGQAVIQVIEGQAVVGSGP